MKMCILIINVSCIMKKNTIYINVCLLLLVSSNILFACNNRRGRSENIKPNSTKEIPAPKIQNERIGKVTFYLENSESMFGYISGITDYVDVVSELSEKPDFVIEKTTRDFYFVNGDKPTLTHIGTDPSILKNKLNKAEFSRGDITKSNLNAMFQIALQNAKNNNISILISDGIYDIGGLGLNSLVTVGTATRSEFIKRLGIGDLQTIMIKLNSQFIGDYFLASKTGKVHINSSRPYYIWIFGDSKLLNKYFSNQYISEKLKGYEAVARFMKPGAINVQYQATSENLIGTFGFDRIENNCLVNAKSDRLGIGFQFAIAVDYSSLPFPESYFSTLTNYSIKSNYSIVSIEKPTKKIFAVDFTPTHLITVQTKKSPCGTLSISLMNNIPIWITDANSNTEANIQTDKTHTYGLKYLTKGITEAYESMSKDQNLANFEIKIR